MRPLRRRAALAAAGVLLAGRVMAQMPILPLGATLRPGQYAWQPETSPSGPVLILVSVAEQLARVYRNGIEIAISTVSTGRDGYVTPTGVFTILQKAREHHSSTYDEASMPFTERLTWDGVALHAGAVPGYPSSHGCVHLPLAFAQLLFGITEVGTTVVIAAAHTQPEDLVHPGLVLPTAEMPAATGAYVWAPERSPTGPCSLLVSIADRRLYALRNGVEIGSADVTFAQPEEPLQPGVFVVLDRASGREDPGRPGRAMPVWTEVGLTDGSAPARRSDVLDRMTLPPAFSAELLPLLVPGTSLYCALAPANADTRTGPGFTVMATQAS